MNIIDIPVPLTSIEKEKLFRSQLKKRYLFSSFVCLLFLAAGLGNIYHALSSRLIQYSPNFYMQLLGGFLLAIIAGGIWWLIIKVHRLLLVTLHKHNSKIVWVQISEQSLPSDGATSTAIMAQVASDESGEDAEELRLLICPPLALKYMNKIFVRSQLLLDTNTHIPVLINTPYGFTAVFSGSVFKTAIHS